MKRLWVIAAVLVLALPFYAACGGGGDQGDSGEENGEEEQEQENGEVEGEADEDLAASEEGILTVWAGGERVDAIELLGEQFDEEYGVQVRVQEVDGDNMVEQFRLAGSAGEGPDMIVGAHDWLGELVANGLVESVDLGEAESSFDDIAVEAFTYEDELYGMPFGLEAVALMYNQDLVPEAPETWEDLRQTATELQESGEVDQGYVLHEADPYHAYPIFSGHGGYVFGQDSAGEYDPSDLGLDSPGAIAGAQEIGSMVDEGLLRPNIEYETMTSLFYDGDAAMFFAGPWTLNDVRESGVDYAVAPIPEMEETPRPFVGAQGFMVSSFSENPVLAQTFLNEFIATEDAMRELYQTPPIAPSWTPLQDEIDEDLEAYAESAADGEPMPAIPQMSAVWNDWENAMIFLKEQEGEPEEVMENAANSIRNNLE